MINEYISLFEKLITEDIIQFKKIDGGVTNKTFLIQTVSNAYILRIAGKGTNEYINRKDEIENMKKVMYLQILPQIFYANKETGVMISQYIQDSVIFKNKDIYNSQKLSLLTNTLITLHNSNIQFNNKFDIEEKILEYQNIINKMHYTYPMDFQKNSNSLKKYFYTLKNNYKETLVPCHVDPKLSNFLLTDTKTYLIDWEYSGMADEYFELANFTLTNELNEEEEKLFLENYVQLSKIDFIKEKYILYKIATDYLWIFWHLIKLYQNQNIEYNERKWKERLNRALKNIKYLEGNSI